MNNEIKVNELEQVSGGTVSELADLMNVISGGNDYAAGTAHAPIVNKVEAIEMKKKLKSLGIDAKIDLGLAGTGLFSSPNVYTNIETGERMTHMQVMGVLQAKG